MSAPEFALQKSICELMAVAYPQVLVMAIPNGAALCGSNDPAGRQRAKREISKLKITGLLPGAPDLALFWTDGIGLVEVKSATGTLQQNQADVLRQLRSLGHRVAVVRSIEDLTQTLADWGVASRIRVAA